MPVKRQRSKKLSNIKYKVLFGFKKDDQNRTGYFGEDCSITTDIRKAKWFPIKNINHLSGFGTPEQWVEYINEDESLNNGYKFHLVNYTKKATI